MALSQAPSTDPNGLSRHKDSSMIYRRFIGAVEDHWILYSDNSSDYTIGSPIGFGASSIVYSAIFHPKSNVPDDSPIPCALKVLDLDSLPPHSLSLLQRETTLMSLSKHPNVLRVRGSWMDGHKLYIALRLMNKGSAADVMRYGWPGGMEEDVIKCILRQTLQGLNYLHINGFIHRDVKAANLLIDDDGTVLLGDLGVAADLSEDTSNASARSHGRAQSVGTEGTVFRSPAHAQQGSDGGSAKHIRLVDPIPRRRPTMGKRKSFVGTPCWMAPELIQGKQYDSSADIWSFGITALELTQGRPPRSRDNPQKVLLKTIQEAPPTLDRDGGTHKYSRAFQEMVASCLEKDPSKRPTADQLLQTPFFKSAKKKSYLVGAILKDLPPLDQRQERRALPYTQTRTSIDSWDFATTMNSPANSAFRRRLLEGLDDGEMHGGVFEMEPESHMIYAMDRRPSHNRTHSKGVSFVEQPETPVLEEAEEDDGGLVSDSDNSAALSPGSSPLTDSTSPTSAENLESHPNDPELVDGPIPQPSAAQGIPKEPIKLSSSPSTSSTASLKVECRTSSVWSKIKGAASKGRPGSSGRRISMIMRPKP